MLKNEPKIILYSKKGMPFELFYQLNKSPQMDKIRTVMNSLQKSIDMHEAFVERIKNTKHDEK